jgi:hypothetical protein
VGTSKGKILVFTGEVLDWGRWSLKFKASLYKDSSLFILNLAALLMPTVVLDICFSFSELVEPFPKFVYGHTCL